jgi:prevent-host-death family protein
MTNMSRRNRSYVNIAEAKAQLSDLVEKAARGEEILIARDHTPIARLVSLEPSRGPRTPGSARGQIWIAPDFDATPSDFDDYTT